METKHLVAGALIGLLVPSGYLVTGVLGNDDFDQTTVESINVTRGGGDALIYLLTWTGSKINFGIAFVGGILVGAALVALLRREFKLEGFERPADMLRYAGGAALMGVGGVLALGCTDRQRAHGHRLAGPDLVHRPAGDGAGRGRDDEMALEEQGMSPTLKTTTANGIHMRYAEAGSGPAGAVLPRLAGILVLVAAPARGGQRGRLPLRRARHARLRRHRGARADRVTTRCSTWSATWPSW